MIQRATGVRRLGIPALLAGVMIAAGAARAQAQETPVPAAAAEPGRREMMEELTALRGRVEQLRQAANRQDERLSAAEVDATVADVIRDADRRSQLLQAQGFTAGYNKGRFVIQSEDGNFSLSPSFQFQARYVANYREEDAGNAIDGDATGEHGFEISRMKMALDGNVFGPDTRYRFQWDAGNNRNGGGGNLVLEEAYVAHRLNFAPDFWVKAGQFKDPTFHEEAVRSSRQLAVDRSLANEVLGGGQTDYIQGAGLIWDDGPEGLPLRGEVGYTDGPNTDNTNFVDAGGAPLFGAANPDFGFYGRAEYLAFGDWRHYDDFSARKNNQDTLVFGAGGFYTQAGDSHVLFHTFDAQYEYNKLGLYAAYYGVFSDGSNAGVGADDGGSSYDFGCVAQAGYSVNDRWEVFGRYSLVSLDTGAAGGDDNFHELTAGVNYYLRGHAAKFTFDATWLPNGTPSNQSQIGVLDPDADGDQFVFRGQFQLLL
jgi:predicted secreted protein